MSDCHGRPHRTATPSEEKARCNKAFCRLIKNRKKRPSCLLCAKIGGCQSDTPKTQGVATQILMSACGAFENFMKERGDHS